MNFSIPLSFLLADATGVQRTWLDPANAGKAQVLDPRRSLGHLLGNGIWLGLDPGAPVPVMAAGEGFETMASLRTVMPALPVAAATSANHLAGLSFPPDCRRQGFASYLLNEAMRHQQQQGVAVIETQTMQQNTNALAMYNRLGFHEVDRGTVFRKQDDPSAIPATLPEQQIPLGTIRPSAL